MLNLRPQAPLRVRWLESWEGQSMADDLRSMVERLKAVSHPLRLRVLALLGAGELCVCQVAEVLQVPQSSASEALRELRRAGFVTERKEGRWVFVSIVSEADVSPLLKGILAEATPLAEVQRDRIRAVEVKALPIPAVCCKVEKAAMTEASHV
jgi:ArsR family transcriptional regulator